MKNAVFTCLSTTDYIPGVLLLSRQVNRLMKKRLHVLCSPGIYQEYHSFLEKRGMVCICAEDMELPIEYKKVLAASHESYWQHTFIKLQLFSQTEYDRIMYIDADILLLQDISSLFEEECFAAVADRDFMQDDELTGINSGVMVFSPDRSFYERLINVFKEEIWTDRVFGDQHIISMALAGSRYHALDASYNAAAYLLDQYETSVKEELKAVHYITSDKPWKWSVIYAMLRTCSYILRGRRMTAHYSRMYYSMCYRIER